MRHIYHISHICSCGELFDHSQGDWDTWRQSHQPKGHKLYSISNEVYDAILERDKIGGKK